MSVPECFPIPGTGRQVCYTLSWSVLVHLFLLGICIPNISCSFIVDVFFHWFHCDCFFLGGLCDDVSLRLCVVLTFLSLPMGKIWCIFESGHMVDSLGY